MITKNENLLRFIGLYVLAYTFPFPFGSLPFTAAITNKLVLVQFQIIKWIGHNVFQVTGEIETYYSGSGDRFMHHLFLISFVFIAVLGTFIWSKVKGLKISTTVLNSWILWYLQLYLAGTMMQYGIVKIMMSQFTEPSFQMLIEPYGNSSPMELAWAFFGYSKGYNLVIGGLELLLGYLLLFKRTRLLGAIIGAGIMLNVLTINLFYDIPVKLHAGHVFLFLWLIIAPNFKKLLAVILMNKAPDNENVTLVFEKQKWLKIQRYTMLVFGILYSVNLIDSVFKIKSSWGDYSPKPAMYGLYEIEDFVINGDTLEPSLNDTVRWRYIGIDKTNTLDIYLMNKSIIKHSIQVDTNKREIEYKLGTSSEAQLMQYTKTDTTLVFSTIYNYDTIHARAKIWNKKDFPLLNRKFQWVTEIPYKRL